MLPHLLARKLVCIKPLACCRTLRCELTVEYADLAIIDISKASTEEGRAELAIEVREALLNHGFFYVVNHGYSQDQAREFFHVVCIINGRVSSQTDRIFDIADLPFSAVSDSEKQIYAGTMKQSGSYQGYKLRQYWVRGCRVSFNMQEYLVYASQSNSAY